MVNRTEANQIAESIREALAGDGNRESRSVLWLSETTGIANSTLARRLGKDEERPGRPEMFTIRELSLIADALDLDFSTLLAGAA